MKVPAAGLFIHHTDTNPADHATAERHQKAIQDFHMDVRKYDDIAYSFIIYPDGLVLEGRGWGIVGAHTEGHNSTAHAFCFAGSFNSDKLTNRARDTSRELWQLGDELGMISREYDLKGHRDVAQTACPGDNLYKEIPYLFFV